MYCELGPGRPPRQSSRCLVYRHDSRSSSRHPSGSPSPWLMESTGCASAGALARHRGAQTKKPPRRPLLSAIRRGLRSRGSGRSRTDDGGFAIRCLSHLATEPWCETQPKRYGKIGGLVKVCVSRRFCRSSRRCRHERLRIASAIRWLGLQFRCFPAVSSRVWPLSRATDRVSGLPIFLFPPGVFRG